MRPRRKLDGLLHILRYHLRRATEGNDVMELCCFLACARLVLKATVRRDAEIRDLAAGRKRLELRVAGQITVEEYFVEVHDLYDDVLECGIKRCASCFFRVFSVLRRLHSYLAHLYRVASSIFGRK